MKAVIQVDDETLAARRAKGLDRWDEMWEGVLHLTPAPSVEHQRVVREVVEFLSPLVTRRGRGQIALQVNVFNEAFRGEDYRIPDLVFVATGREHVFAKDGIRGGPDVVIEIRSPNDETYDKLPFYAALGVREALVIDSVTKRVELFRLAGNQLAAVPAGPDGWLRSEALHARFISSDARLIVEDADDPAARVTI
jgi:Uma2 family endonuclease